MRLPSQVIVTEDDAVSTPFTSTEFAALALLIWDVLINLSDEIEYVWQERRTSWVKWTYLFVRYMPIVLESSTMVLSVSPGTTIQFSRAGCLAWLLFQAIISLSLLWVVESILIIRVYVIYRCNKVLLGVLLFIYSLEVTAMLFSVVETVPKVEVTQGCLVIKSPRVYLICWLSMFAFQTILFLLTVLNFLRSVDRRMGGRSLLRTVVRDGCWAYGLMAAAELVNSLMFQLDISALSGIFFTWSLVVLSLTTAHMQINLLKHSTNPNDADLLSNELMTTNLAFAPEPVSTDDTAVTDTTQTIACV